MTISVDPLHNGIFPQGDRFWNERYIVTHHKMIHLQVLSLQCMIRYHLYRTEDKVSHELFLRVGLLVI